MGIFIHILNNWPLILSLTVNIGWAILWFVKFRKEWHEGTMLKKQLQEYKHKEELYSNIYKWLSERTHDPSVQLILGCCPISFDDFKKRFPEEKEMVLSECWQLLVNVGKIYLYPDLLNQYCITREYKNAKT
jgi:hypothetical protein